MDECCAYSSHVPGFLFVSFNALFLFYLFQIPYRKVLGLSLDIPALYHALHDWLKALISIFNIFTFCISVFLYL
jgi:hypothetical protein